MSWCDKLACVPSVGVKLNTRVLSSASILDSMAPLLNKWVNGDTLQFNVDKVNPFDVFITTNDGFQYGVEPAKVFVDFTYNMTMRTVSAGPPVAQMLSQPRPYTVLLPELLARLVELMHHLPNSKERTVSRVGIMSTTTVAFDDAPPGIRRLIEHINQPWGKIADNYQFVVNGELSRDQNKIDRCIHTIVKQSEAEDLISLKFDWQHYLLSPRIVTKDSLDEIMASAQKSALQYFEELGEGRKFDAEIIRESAKI